LNGCPSSGGGGGGTGYVFSTAGKGGSGVIIIRYRSPLPATSLIDYLKSNSPAVVDYKAGMSGGDYKIQSIQSSITKDRFVVNASSGNVHIGESALVIKSTGEVNISSVLNTKSLLIDGIANQFSTLTSRPTMYVGSGSFTYVNDSQGATYAIHINASTIYNSIIQISINDIVISHSILWKNNIPTVTNYYTYNDNSYYVSLIEYLGGVSYRYIFWRRSGTFVWRVQEFL
jgi:hypothetical protein